MAKGVDFLVSVQTGTDGTTGDPIYTNVLGQRGGTFNRAQGTLDTTSKDSNGWESSDYANGNWSINADGTLDENDTALDTLDTAFMGQTTVKVQFIFPSGKKYEGDALITDFPVDAPYDGVATYSITLTGTGKPTEIAAA